VTYRQGTTATLLAQFYAYAGGPAADVTGLTITISPTGGGAAILGPTSTGVVHESTGLYSYPWAIGAALATGTYVVEWNADDDVTASESVEVIVGWSHSYATLTLLKDALGITDTARDDLLNQALVTASRSADAHTGRRFYADTSASTRTWPARGRVARDADGELLLVDDIASTTDLVVETGDGTTWTAASGYWTDPDNALALGRPITGIRLNTEARGRVRVTARWGWPAVPDQVVQATLMQAARLFKRKDSPEGVMGSAEWGPIRVSRIDPDVKALLASFVLPRLA
jgi:hypothetical protein